MAFKGSLNPLSSFAASPCPWHPALQTTLQPTGPSQNLPATGLPSLTREWANRDTE